MSRPLRRWQAEALELYHGEERRDFLVTATPGAGKTTFALTLAAGLLEARLVTRVVVVAPTDHLRKQWADAAVPFHLTLDPSMANSDGGVIRAGTHGYVTTYAQVAMRPEVHAMRVSQQPTLVILDEIHHAGDGMTWGDGVTIAFDAAVRRLALTGTPFRTQADSQIPFVTYMRGEEGDLVSVADYTYGYRHALADGVVRPVVFAAYTGNARWRNSAGDVVAAGLTDQVSKKVESEAWRAVLDPAGAWVPHVVSAMDERLTHLRATTMPDAGGLILASDQETAKAYAAVVEQVTGEAPTVIVSEDPKASEKLDAFTNDPSQKIAVCVRLISEGVDVPRLACMAWLTSYRTPLFFAQAVGRVVRSRHASESATVFLPAVRPLLALAAEMETERNHVVAAIAADGDFDPESQAVDVLDEPPVELPESAKSSEWETLEAAAQFAHVLASGRAVTAPVDTQPLDEDSDFLGLPGLLSPEQTAALLAQRDAEHRRAAHASRTITGTATATIEDPARAAGSWRAMKELRSEITRLVNRYAARTSTPHALVHSRVRQAVPGPATAQADYDVLTRRRDTLMEWLG